MVRRTGFHPVNMDSSSVGATKNTNGIMMKLVNIVGLKLTVERFAGSSPASPTKRFPERLMIKFIKGFISKWSNNGMRLDYSLIRVRVKSNSNQ